MESPKMFLDELLENGEKLAYFLGENLTLDALSETYEFRGKPSDIDNFLHETEIALLLGEYKKISEKEYVVSPIYHPILDNILKEKPKEITYVVPELFYVA